MPEWKEANARIEALAAMARGPTRLVLASRQSRANAHSQAWRFTQARLDGRGGRAGILHPLLPATGPRGFVGPMARRSAKSPTAARAVVNRVWQAYFGTGIVTTSEDLGTQSETHPASGIAGLAGLRVDGFGLET